jgi:hypothetical protein
VQHWLQQSVIFIAYRSETFTRDPLQACGVDHLEFLSAALNQAAILQVGGRFVYAGPPDPQQLCDELVRHA